MCVVGAGTGADVPQEFARESDSVLGLEQAGIWGHGMGAEEGGVCDCQVHLLGSGEAEREGDARGRMRRHSKAPSRGCRNKATDENTRDRDCPGKSRRGGKLGESRGEGKGRGQQEMTKL